MTDPPVPQKSADAYRTISEVAEDLKLPQHVLRFWETRFPQVKPLKRAGGRRFYRPDDVALLRAVQTLLYRDGYTIKGVQRLLAEFGARHVADALLRSGAAEHGRSGGDERIASTMPEEDGPARRVQVSGDRRFTPAPDGPEPARPVPAGPGDVAIRLGAVLADLLECGRLLSTVRST